MGFVWRLSLAPCVVSFACSGGPASRPGTAVQSAIPAVPQPQIKTSLGTLVKTERVSSVTLQTRCIKSASDKMVGVVSGENVPDPFSTAKRGEVDVFTAKPGVVVFAILDMVGVCAVSEQAAAGKDFLVLSFEGTAGRSLNEEGTMAKFLAAGAGGLLTRVDSKSQFGDAARSLQIPGLVLSAEENRRQIAFELATSQKELIWHDDKAAYRLDPQPRLLPAPASSGAEAAK